MKTLKYITLLLFFNITSAQLMTDYKAFSKKLTKIRQYNFKDSKNDCSQKILYLGKITLTNKQTFKVLTSHINLGGKGVNDLIFISEKNVEYIYRLDLPSDFPTYISKNKLYFDKNESMSVNELKELFCTPSGCFNRK